MHNNMFMISRLPRIAPLPASLFNTLVGLLVFIELPLFIILIGMDPLPAGLLSTLAGLPYNYIII